MNTADREERMAIVVTAIPHADGCLSNETRQALRDHGAWIEGKTVAELVALYKCSGESEALNRALHAAYVCTVTIPTLCSFTRETFGRILTEWAEQGLHQP